MYYLVHIFIVFIIFIIIILFSHKENGVHIDVINNDKKNNNAESKAVML